ncbi:hypothetical protein L914_10288 [Phytophthora nicotianae]|uniref:Uncharacterized protein n=1 Tax=Phytophthora nicotianae TaxID=4792 RepID=W2N732_PHYNI|nr:hypothetical protein L914_10288 [Phytophthora nicotianae]
MSPLEAIPRKMIHWKRKQWPLPTRVMTLVTCIWAAVAMTVAGNRLKRTYQELLVLLDIELVGV